MNNEAPAYGLWWLVIINAAVFIIFAFSFAKPRSGRDWRSLAHSPLFWWRCSRRCMVSH